MIRQNPRTNIVHVSFIFMFVFFCGSVSGDEIVLKNGDRLTGTVSTAGEDTLTFETGHSEPIQIKTSEIQSITTDTAVEIHLSSGEILKGKITTDESGDLIIEASDERETAVFGWDKVSAVNPPVKPSKWKGNVSVGASLQTGNIDRSNVSFGAEAARRTERDRFSLRFLYNFSEEDDEVTARNYYGALKYDYFFTEKFYAYLGVELLKDKFKDLQLRTAIGPGVGYQIWDDAVKFLAVEAGISYFSEDLKKGDDKDWVTARLAGNFSYTIRDALVFSDQLIVYPSLENGRDYKLRNEAAITSLLVAGWSLKLTNILEHDGNPPEDVERNDWFWILGVQYSF